MPVGADAGYVGELVAALTLSAGVKVFLATEALDLRREHDGLCALVRGTLALDPFPDHLFVLVGVASTVFRG